MGFRCGIIGLPNVGKSTLFNALTRTSAAQAENYPFCTIEPNIGEVDVPDKRLEILSKINKSQKILPARLTFVDIAGLVKGASQGEGLGNQFLSNIKEVDAVAHVVRCFEDDNITHVNGQIDPIRDIEIIETELLLSDIANLEKRQTSLEKKAKSNDKESKEKLILIEEILEKLNNNILFDLKSLDEKNQKYFQEFALLTGKKIIYVCNVDEESAKSGNQYSEKIHEYGMSKEINVIKISANIESQISELSDEDRDEYIKSLGLAEPGLNALINEGYNALDLITYFTSGPKETRAWTITKNTLAPKSAGKIHTDFEKGFIRAETINYDELTNFSSYNEAKDAGRIRLEGKEYEVKDGDIMNFRFNN
ncbi:MAG: redox-regulated ATPase YchF [Rhodobiaceae bacterium]|nr:redox-regulated ATPase YchF [Rhodobiaceae bacterium]|tara:strand:- start:1647 stop:2744 length:1098 start_codon:yes stop_codon:yes gene_type:complete